MASMLFDGETVRYPAPPISMLLPTLPGGQESESLASMSEMVSSFLRPEESCATVLPGPSSNRHQPTSPSSSGSLGSTTRSSCGEHAAASDAASAIAAALKARTDPPVDQHGRAVEARLRR